MTCLKKLEIIRAFWREIEDFPAVSLPPPILKQGQVKYDKKCTVQNSTINPSKSKLGYWSPEELHFRGSGSL